jgi:hypothetical protein
VEGVAEQVIDLLILLDEEARAIPHDHPLYMRGRGGVMSHFLRDSFRHCARY